MTSGNSLSTAGLTKLAATMIVGVILIAAVLAPMLNDLTRETIVENYNDPDDASWIRMNYGTENIDTEYSVAGDTLTVGDQSGAAQDMILYADEKACVMYSDGFTIVNGYSDPATVTKADTVHITNADGTLTISDGTDIIIQTTSPAWAYYPDKEGTYGYFSADVQGVKVKDGNQAMAGNFAGVYTYNDIVIGPDNLGDLGMSIDMDIQDGVIQTITWAKGVADADTDDLTDANVGGSSSMPNLGASYGPDPSTGTRIGDLYYTFNGTNATVIGYASTIDWTTFTTIPNTVVNEGTTYTVTYIGNQAFQNCTNLVLTSLPSGLTTIGRNAFSGCSNLALTSLPSSLTKINYGGFMDCTNLALTSLPNGITTLEYYAFQNCTNLALTSLPDNISTIMSATFEGCTSLALTSLPSGLTSIENDAFDGCTNLALTSLPAGVTRIDYNAFQNCTNLALTSLPAGLTYIGSSAFSGCTNLALTSIPNGVTTYYNTTFSGCSSLTLSTLPEGLRDIRIGVFSQCTGLEHITLPTSLENLGGNAFLECTNLKSLIVQSSPTIGQNAFRYCTNLKQVLNLGDTEITTTSYGLNADEVRSDIPAMGYVAPLSYTKVVVKEGTAYDILLMMPVLLVIALLIPIADYFVGDNIRSRIR